MRDADATLVADHLTHLHRLGRRPRTIEARRDAVRRFTRRASTPLLDADRHDVQAYIDLAVAPATKRVYLAHLRGFYGWCVDEGHLVVDPTRRVYGPRFQRNLPRPVGEADLALAMHTATPMIRTWLMLSAFAGLRACEIGPVRGEHVTKQGGRHLLFIPEAKGGGEAMVPLAPALASAMRDFPRHGWAWKPDGPYHSIVVSRLVSQHFRDLGIAATLHMCRHRFGTQAYMTSGRDLRLTQELLRHSSPATTAIYTAFDPVEAASVVDRLPMPSRGEAVLGTS